LANTEMTIDSIRVSEMYQRVVILKEKQGTRLLPIWIGIAGADAIAAKMQEIELPRPLTHDFMCAAVDALGGSFQAVIINKLEEEVFYAKAILQANNERKEIDCGPSDALAVAVRGATPILVDEEVLEKASIASPVVEPTERKVDEERRDIFSPVLFSEDAQDILAASEVEARQMHHDYTSTGHMLIALAKRKSTASTIMEDTGADLGSIQKNLKALLKKEHAVEGGGVGPTPAAKDAIQISIIEATKLGSEMVLPEHILLGLMRASDGIAASQLSITPETVYWLLIQLRSKS